MVFPYISFLNLIQLQKKFISKGILHSTLLQSFPDIGLDPMKLYASLSSLYSFKFSLDINFSFKLVYFKIPAAEVSQLAEQRFQDTLQSIYPQLKHRLPSIFIRK